MSGDTTVTSDGGSEPREPSWVQHFFALVIVWSAHEPHRVGEVALLTGTGEMVLGRTHDDLLLIGFVRQRPGRNEFTDGLEDIGVSRRQLEITIEDDDVLTLVDIGSKAKLAVGGVRVEKARVEVGDVFGIDGHYLFLVTKRPQKLAALEHVKPMHEFGEVDERGFVGESPAAWNLREDVSHVAAARGHVLVRGPSGTGKELVAKAIHVASNVRGEFVAQNCAAFSSGLMAADLFGHERNYPNAGMPERIGLVGQAENGTLLLDEIGELPKELQAMLLRLLTANEFVRVGASIARPANVRVIGATNRDETEMKFDLVPRFEHAIEVPGLDERAEDIPLIARAIVLEIAAKEPDVARFVRNEKGHTFVAFDPRFIEALVTHTYTTHVHELRKLLRVAMRATRGNVIPMIAELVTKPRPKTTEITEAGVRKALAKHDNVLLRASKELGITRWALGRLIEKYKIMIPRTP